MPSIESSSSQLPIANARTAESSSCNRPFAHYKSEIEAVHMMALAASRGTVLARRSSDCQHRSHETDERAASAPSSPNLRYLRVFLNLAER